MALLGWLHSRNDLDGGQQTVTMKVFTWGAVEDYTYKEDEFEDTLMECIVGVRKA